MRFKKYMQKIIEQLGNYKNTVDTLAKAYQAECKKRDEQFESMKGKYTDSYISECRRNWEPLTKYAEIITTEREKHYKIAVTYLDKIKTEMDGYFKIPVDPGFAATVSAIKTLGVTLNNKEFEVLQGAAGGFWGLRLLNELATSRTKTEQAAELENGQAKRVEKEVPKPYTGVELPDIKQAYESLQNVKNSLNMAFEGYCGESYELKDIVFPLSKTTEETNAKIESAYGVKAQPQKRDNLTISKMATSKKCFDENYHSYTGFSEMMGGLAATMPEPKQKETLTDDDKKLIDTLIDSRYESLAKDQAVQIAKADEHLAEILMLDTRYGAAVKTALGEVSENE